MCGIGGILKDNNIQNSVINKMILSMESRGPNAKGFWKDEKDKIAFVHTRLSIIDLSNNASQPMHSKSTRYVIVFNGEIYNHQIIRSLLQKENPKIIWNGTGDTETLLEAIDFWGLDKTLSLIDGMFAFAVWDKKKRKLFLVRDKFGEKPLYYGWNNGVFLFGSDILSIKQHNNFDNKINKKSLDYYFKLSYIPAPLTIFCSVSKLIPGHYLTIDTLNDYKLTLKSYWNISKLVKDNKKNIIRESDNYYTTTCENLLSESVISRSISDVPIGTFLSSGVDSTLISLLLQKNSKNKINTFTVGYESILNDETTLAKSISSYIGTNHHELRINFQNIFETINEISETYSEPFADSSQIPTMIISKFAKQNVSVVLTGDAGDEVFGGYNRYIWLSYFLKLNSTKKKIFLLIIQLLKKNSYFILSLEKIFKPFIKDNNFLLKIDKIHSLLKSNEFKEMYFSLIFHDNFKDSVLKDNLDNNHSIYNLDEDYLLSEVEKIMIKDSQTYLPDDVLCKVDRGSMKFSLETRCPFLNENLFQFSWSIPEDLKIRKNINKYILRSILEKHLPKRLINKNKMGFNIPMRDWLKNRLKNWSEEVLFSNKNVFEEFIDQEKVKNIWNEHQKSKLDRSKILWNLIVFNNWYTKWN